ncbi:MULTISPECIES: helix-turn-helix domain-containing protein [Clostridia]|uniref:helix-turn-helix domain-containing protein n=1 Tax=Clostridia TaxID=186801 RepID=UPI000EA40747|nr:MULTISPECIES: helix-turn-helix domain-containing protein [Clostridia]NBJ71021.1 helix-turn-helix domain containing protein [Roseburia sp. 1XD42-34]RKI75456.1 helix-turn-helix domain containing protein [Clostridium sp. 1xD42-85]
MRRQWTTKEVGYIKRAALLDSTNDVVNLEQMAKHLNRSVSAVSKRIWLLRQEGDFPEIDKGKAIDTAGKPYSDEDIKRIKFMVKKGSTAKEIAESLGRTESSIYSVIGRLRRKGVIKTTSKKMWNSSDVHYLINNIQFDENGYTTNTKELARALNRPYQSVTYKISQLRRDDVLTVKADMTKTSVKAKQAHDEFNQKRFATLGKEVRNVVTTPSKAEVVPVILTVSSNSTGEEIHQYWTLDGKLLAENKKAVSCN